MNAESSTAGNHLLVETEQLVCTYGDPKVYGRVGYHAVDTETIPAPFALTQPEGWLCQWLNEAPVPSVAGPSHCVPPFDNPDYW